MLAGAPGGVSRRRDVGWEGGEARGGRKQASGGRRGINQTGTRRYRGIQNRRRIAPALASRRWKEDLRAADYFPIIYPVGGGGGETGEAEGEYAPGGGFPAAEDEAEEEEVVEEEEEVKEGVTGWRRDGGTTAVGCLLLLLLLLESGRAHTTDTIAAINTGEQPLTSPTGGPILYFISKLIPREQIYCKKGVKKYIFSAHGPPPARRPHRPPGSLHLDLPSLYPPDLSR